ncbi:MAG: MFS transporter [Propionibacteriaceae bacterium]|nr:MFS transporter [Propionibacteriaceae bacterium]
MTKNFRWLWALAVFSNMADGFLGVSVSLLAIRVTDDPFLVSLAGLCSTIPVLIFSLPSGALADRFPRLNLMLVANVCRCGLLGVLTWLVIAESLPFVGLCALLAVIAIFEPVYDTSNISLIPALAGRDKLVEANARIQGTQLVAQTMIAVPLAAFLFSAAIFAPFAVALACYAITVLIVFIMRWILKINTTPSASPSEEKVSWGKSIAEGWRYVRESKTLFVLFIFAGVSAFFSVFSQSVSTMYFIKNFNVPEALVGAFMILPALAGLLGMAAAPKLVQKLGQVPALLVSCAIDAAMLVAIGFANNPWMGGVFVCVRYLGAPTAGIVISAMRQAAASDEILGRVNSLSAMVVMAGTLVGQPLGGFLAGFDMRLPWWIGGLCLAILYVFVGKTLWGMEKTKPEPELAEVAG